MEFSSEEFLDAIVPCSGEIVSLIEKHISECVLWNEVDQAIEINGQEIKKFSEELIKLKIAKSDIIHSIALVLIQKENYDENITSMETDMQVLMLSTSTLYLVNTGHFDIVFWLEITLDICNFFNVHGLVSFTKWICGCYEEFNWAISNPSIPFDQRGTSQGNTERDSKSTPDPDISPSVAAQRQLAQAKFVGLLKVVGRRLIGYHCINEAGILRCFVFSILPTNQAGICRKSFTPRAYSSFNIDKQLESILEASTLTVDSETLTNYDIDKEDGEMSSKVNDSFDLNKSDYQRFLYPSKYVKNVIEAYKKVDRFFQTSSDFLSSIVEHSETLSSSKRKQIDDICKDIETVVSYFEDYKCISITNSQTHARLLVSILEGIPSSFESYYFRVNFAYKLSFILCFQLARVSDGNKNGYEYMQNKLIPLLQKCLGTIDKLNNNHSSVTIFINTMIKYELLWQSWKNSNCVDVCIPSEKLASLPEITKASIDLRAGTKKRRIDQIGNITKFIDDETFNNYMYFVGGNSDQNCIENFNSITIKNINLPNFTTERKSLYLDPINLDSYSLKTFNSKVANKLNDYKEKILIDLDPDNGIDESEKSIKDPLIKWRFNRLQQRVDMEKLNRLSETQLSINDIESLVSSPIVQESNNSLDKDEFEFLKIYH
ncbi:hypothetical protein OJ253_1080 [Cryptosporidium canis]|uniref:Uncharacterized protein n=1 Tax=Cryptosporidium canis TaxID=195482 RepID=A0A9D5DN52_9CRYT|nr:hypothetical protein OJ253_1080 [Cryptosporidium canis]